MPRCAGGRRPCVGARIPRGRIELLGRGERHPTGLKRHLLPGASPVLEAPARLAGWPAMTLRAGLGGRLCPAAPGAWYTGERGSRALVGMLGQAAHHGRARPHAGLCGGRHLLQPSQWRSSLRRGMGGQLEWRAAGRLRAIWRARRKGNSPDRSRSGNPINRLKKTRKSNPSPGCVPQRLPAVGSAEIQRRGFCARRQPSIRSTCQRVENKIAERSQA